MEDSCKQIIPIPLFAKDSTMKPFYLSLIIPFLCFSTSASPESAQTNETNIIFDTTNPKIKNKKTYSPLQIKEVLPLKKEKIWKEKLAAKIELEYNSPIISYESTSPNQYNYEFNIETHYALSKEILFNTELKGKYLFKEGSENSNEINPLKVGFISKNFLSWGNNKLTPKINYVFGNKEMDFGLALGIYLKSKFVLFGKNLTSQFKSILEQDFFSNKPNDNVFKQYEIEHEVSLKLKLNKLFSLKSKFNYKQNWYFNSKSKEKVEIEEGFLIPIHPNFEIEMGHKNLTTIKDKNNKRESIKWYSRENSKVYFQLNCNL